MEYFRGNSNFSRDFFEKALWICCYIIHKFIVMLHVCNTIKKIQLMLSKIMNYIDLPFTYVSTFVKSSAVVCVV